MGEGGKGQADSYQGNTITQEMKVREVILHVHIVKRLEKFLYL